MTKHDQKNNRGRLGLALAACCVLTSLNPTIAQDQTISATDRMATIMTWAESTKTMEAHLIGAINQPDNPGVTDFVNDAIDMAWYDLDDSGLLQRLQQDAGAGTNKATWHGRADALEALYTGCFFPRWVKAWSLLRPTETAFEAWMKTPPDDADATATAEATMNAANDAYYAARAAAQDCVNSAILSDLAYSW